MPGINTLFIGIYMNRFANVMQLLIGAGVPILDSLKIGSTVINNVIYEDSLSNVALQVERGVPLSVQLAKESVFPPMVGQMIAVGEETGELEKVLGKVSQYYQETSSENLKIISTLIEPIILVIIGIAVAFMVFSIILPIYSIAQVGG
jgi:type II secretory pathway component PulF